MRDGRVETAGPAASTPVPAGLPVVEGGGGTAMPGTVLAATRLGLPAPQGAPDRPTPMETVAEELPPAPRVLRIAAREGCTLAGLLPGPGAPGGEGLSVRPPSAGTGAFLVPAGRVLRVDVDPSTGWARGLAGTFDAAKKEVENEEKSEKEQAAYRAALAAFEAKKAAPGTGDPGKQPAEPKPFKPEERTRIVRDAVRRKVAVVVFAGSAGDVDRALDALGPFKLRLAFRVSGDAWRAAARVAGAGATAILDPQVQNEPGSLNRVNPAAVFDAAGCPVAFVPRDEGRRGLASLRTDVGLLVHAGLPRKAAVRGLALEGARVLGLESDAGTVAPGRPADLLLFDGDPLEAATRLRAAWCAGRRIEGAGPPGDHP